MRIVIDLQGAQSNSRLRGIGRYTLSLTKAIIRNRSEHEIIIALSGLFPETIEIIRADFDGLLPQDNIRVWYAPGPVNHNEPANNWRRKVAEIVREAFLASLKPDFVILTSLFEGLGDDTVTSIGLLGNNLPTAVILYDLIPFIHRHSYLKDPAVESWYEDKLDYLRQGNLFLAISESSRQEAIDYLSISEDILVNISSAADSQFKPQSISKRRELEIRNKYGLKNPYIMYTGGIDHRKNIEGLIRSYANLPKQIRTKHQLAVVCSIQTQDRGRLKALAKEYKLKSNELVLTGFVPEDDLVILYDLCKMFVFPSWHEGFGLPVLEAMSCGRAVIGANITGVPEVIGLEDALFDPKADQAITDKMHKVITDDAFRAELEYHGLKQAKNFSWDKSAKKAINALERFYKKNQVIKTFTPNQKPTLAFVSPLLPLRSGISHYSKELLPELSKYYEIDVIVDQDVISDSWVNTNCQIRSIEWFKLHAKNYERVLYHFGNSVFHQHMFSLLKEVTGIVVLHDFFLSGIEHLIESHGFISNFWSSELYQSHGYNALKERFHATNVFDVMAKYPCSLDVLRRAKGVIAHSESSRKLAKMWYGKNEMTNLSVIPLLRTPNFNIDKTKSRKKLKLSADDFVICTFGLLHQHKLNHCLLEAWLASDLAKDNNCKLIFVGENHQGEYGKELLTTIRRSGLKGQIHITGWTDMEIYQHYLSAADIGVQLRTMSRGETSAAVLDCMNYGLATIVNANGSMTDLSSDAVWKMADNFDNKHLIEALETLRHDNSRRTQLGDNAQKHIRELHAPRTCAEQYFNAIEDFYKDTVFDVNSLTSAISKVELTAKNSKELLPLAEAIAQSIAPRYFLRQLFIDVSELVEQNANTGIQRVVKSILFEWLNNPPKGVRIEPVYATAEKKGYYYARNFTLDFLKCPPNILSDELIEYHSGDIFLGLNSQPQIVPSHKVFYQKLRNDGVRVQFVVYDLLCILMPKYFVKGAFECHSRWLKEVVENDGVICMTKTVANEFEDWMKEFSPKRLRPFNISSFHLGSDFNLNKKTQEILDSTSKILKAVQAGTSFIMVGSIEPRKGHAQTLAAFKQLWAEGENINLVIVGKEGWMVEKIIEQLRQHPELGKRLFWFESMDDELLKKTYSASSCLLAASEGEGFGLPLIEAAQNSLPIIARDIKVFREVAGENAYYFKGISAEELASAIKNWLSLFKKSEQPTSDNLPWISLKDSAQQLLNAILKE